jgi:hypothetical protein
MSSLRLRSNVVKPCDLSRTFSFLLATPGSLGEHRGMNVKLWISTVVAVTLAGQSAVAQLPQANVPGLDAALTKLFGNNNAFTATATARLLDEKETETMSMPMSYALLDGKIRSEIDMTQVKSKQMPAEANAMLKQMGVDKMVSIVRPDKQTQLIVYPTARAYAEMPIGKGTNASGPQDYKMESTKLGTETVDGHPCVKNKVIISSQGSEKHEAIVWNATDLKDFPVKMQMAQAGGGNLVMTYSRIKLEKPDAKLFEPPTDFEKHDSVEKLLQTVMMKMLANPGALPQRDGP